jgi:hypothetical protein
MTQASIKIICKAGRFRDHIQTSNNFTQLRKRIESKRGSGMYSTFAPLKYNLQQALENPAKGVQLEAYGMFVYQHIHHLCNISTSKTKIDAHLRRAR